MKPYPIPGLNCQPEHLINGFDTLCRVCGKQLEQKPRYNYAPPFVAPKEWCPEHGYNWEQK